MDNESIKFAILTEAAKNGNHVYKLKSDTGDYIKLKHSYSQPDEIRDQYLTALNGLLNSRLVQKVFSTDDIELYELTESGLSFTTLASAMERIKHELQAFGRVYKIHSSKGEFVQSGAESFNKIDSERIVYLQALHMLLYHGFARVVSESKEMATYELDRTNQLYCEQLKLAEERVSPDKYAA
ncbi:MAG: hypothetical protein JST44_27840 [Cyanobacteria bacterium SZAS LIN-5]|nr:hypothetical protein [Cyanobacteria bacterium SZAS LIN-5]